MINSLEKNDRVMTVGGLIGVIHSVDKEQNEVKNVNIISSKGSRFGPESDVTVNNLPPPTPQLNMQMS